MYLLAMPGRFITLLLDLPTQQATRVSPQHAYRLMPSPANVTYAGQLKNTPVQPLFQAC